MPGFPGALGALKWLGGPLEPSSVFSGSPSTMTVQVAEPDWLICHAVSVCGPRGRPGQTTAIAPLLLPQPIPPYFTRFGPSLTKIGFPAWKPATVTLPLWPVVTVSGHVMVSVEGEGPVQAVGQQVGRDVLSGSALAGPAPSPITAKPPARRTPAANFFRLG